MVHIDKSFMKCPEKLDKDFYKLSSAMTLGEAKDFAENLENEEFFVVLNTWYSENSFSGIIYGYRNGKPYKRAFLHVVVSGLGITENQFLKYYENKTLKLGKMLEKPYGYAYRPEETGDDIGGITVHVDGVYTEHDWQNEMALERLEADMLQPDDAC